MSTCPEIDLALLSFGMLSFDNALLLHEERQGFFISSVLAEKLQKRLPSRQMIATLPYSSNCYFLPAIRAI